jgi:hypothetical protein
MARPLWTNGEGLLGEAAGGGAQPSDGVFCSKESLDYAVAAVTQRLQATGLAALPPLRTLEEEHRIKLVNLVHSVLRLKDVGGTMTGAPVGTCGWLSLGGCRVSGGGGVGAGHGAKVPDDDERPRDGTAAAGAHPEWVWGAHIHADPKMPGAGGC